MVEAEKLLLSILTLRKLAFFITVQQLTQIIDFVQKVAKELSLKLSIS